MVDFVAHWVLMKVLPKAEIDTGPEVTKDEPGEAILQGDAATPVPG
jgi:hypothetical protein